MQARSLEDIVATPAANDPAPRYSKTNILKNFTDLNGVNILMILISF
jgi:hypothetical protein